MFKKVTFVKTAILPEDYPLFQDSKGTLQPEIAVIGRSNVGKSSLLNDLFQMPGMAKTAKRPGKTQGLNFFETDEGPVFVDLPGYGYAKVSNALKETWSEALSAYLNERQPLQLVLFLLDMRHLPSEEDRVFMHWLKKRQLPAILVLTKADKVKLGERPKQTAAILAALRTTSYPVVHYSSVKHEGRKQLIGQITACLS